MFDVEVLEIQRDEHMEGRYDPVAEEHIEEQHVPVQHEEHVGHEDVTTRDEGEL